MGAQAARRGHSSWTAFALAALLVLPALPPPALADGEALDDLPASQRANVALADALLAVLQDPARDGASQALDAAGALLAGRLAAGGAAPDPAALEGEQADLALARALLDRLRAAPAGDLAALRGALGDAFAARLPAGAAEQGAAFLARLDRALGLAGAPEGGEPLRRAGALAHGAMRAQALELGIAWGPAPAVPASASPSAAARALLDAHGVEPDPAQERGLASLDALPPPAARALAVLLDAFRAYELAAVQAFAGADPEGLEAFGDAAGFHLGGDLAAEAPVLALGPRGLVDAVRRAHDDGEVPAWPPRPAREAVPVPPPGDLLRTAGIDLAPVFPARAALLDASVGFADARASLPVSVPVFLDVPGVLLLDLGESSDEHAVDYALLVDGGGDDTYLNNAGGSNLLGGACPNLLPTIGPISFLPPRVNITWNPRGTGVAAALDLGGDDDYANRRSCGAAGGAFLGVGFLLDAAGDDRYGRPPGAAPAGLPGATSEGAPEAHAAPLAALPEAADPQRRIVGFHEAPPLAPGDAYLGAEVLGVNAALRFAAMRAPDPGFDALALADPAVRYVEPDATVRAHLVPSDPLFAEQYGPVQARAPEAWDTALGSTATSLCVVDTGVRHTHEDLAGPRWLGGIDFVNDDADPMDDNGHGTHVAGIAAATLGNGKGIAGMAQVALLGAKVLRANAVGTLDDVASGIQWCADQGADVISMSLGTSSNTALLRDAVAYAAGKGALLVASAGNDGCRGCVSYPAAYPDVIAVTCSDPRGLRCGFGNYGAHNELAAAGLRVPSAWAARDDAYASLSGTSMSAPHVSGAAALVWSAVPELTAPQVRQLLRDGALDAGPAGCDEEYGFGLLDVRAALDAALAGARPGLGPAPRCEGGSTMGANGGGHLGGAGFLLDAEGRDTYLAGWNGTNGGGFLGGVGLLVDGAGSDAYSAGEQGTNGGGVAGLGALLDGGGSDTYHAGSLGTNGGAQLGQGLLVDAGGDDTYAAGFQGANGGGLQGAGLLLDAGGSDRYQSEVFGVNGGSSGTGGVGGLVDLGGDDTYDACCLGANGGGDGNAFAVLLDRGGADAYLAAGLGGNGGQARSGSAFLLDGGGDDLYDSCCLGVMGGAVENGGRGFLLDAGGADAYVALGGSAATGGGFLADGFLLDAGPEGDLYLAGWAAAHGGALLGRGFLLDEAGDDVYAAGGLGTNGGGYFSTRSGQLLDGGGRDLYAGEDAGVNGGGRDAPGLLVDAGAGDDVYSAAGFGTNGGACCTLPNSLTPSRGALLDGGGRDTYDAAYYGVNGGAADFGAGYLLDASGDDAYRSEGFDGLHEAPRALLRSPAPGEAGAFGGPRPSFLAGVRGPLPEGAFHGAPVRSADASLGLVEVAPRDLPGFVRAALADPAVRWLEPEGEFRAQAAPDDPLFGLQGGAPLLRAPEAWDTTLGSAARNVCVVDSGVWHTHEDLAGPRWRGGWDAVDEDADPRDDLGHGTHVAGLAAATTGNGKGIAGVAQAGLLAAKVLDSSGLGTSADVAQGIRWCADHEGHVISMSLGGPRSSAVRDAVRYAWDQGSLLVAAAGNGGCYGCVGYPAAHEEVIAVTCTDAWVHANGFTVLPHCAFNSEGPEAELTADGLDELSTFAFGDANYVRLSGTSMSAPLVSGAAALLWSAAPDLSNGALRQLLRDTARENVEGFPQACDPGFGYGLPDLRAALDAALAGARPELREHCMAGAYGANGGGYNGATGFLLDAEGYDTYLGPRGLGSNGGASGCARSCLFVRTAAAEGLLLDRRGGDAYDDGEAVGADLTVTPKGTHGAQVDLNKPPAAAGNIEPALADRAHAVRFTDRSADADGALVVWRWDFGDGATSPEPNPLHTYAALGSYEVSLEVTDDDGDTARAAVGVVEVRNLAPLARIGAPEVANRLDAVPFADLSVDEDGVVAARAWDFGDGSASEERNPTHRFARLGEHVVALTVRDDDGASASAARVVRVLNLPPGADFAYAPPWPMAGQPVLFDGRGSDRDGRIASWHWDFGDGGSSASQRPAHAFARPGNYLVRLTVTDDDGGAATAAKGVVVCGVHAGTYPVPGVSFGAEVCFSTG